VNVSAFVSRFPFESLAVALQPLQVSISVH
jgi:hypothetical protein